MSGDVVVDSTVLVDLERGRTEALVVLRPLIERHIARVHPISTMEVLSGARTRREFESLRRLIDVLKITPVKASDMTAAVDLLCQFHLSHSIGWPDCVIASTARRLGIPVVTTNARHFKLVKGLSVIVPY